MTQKLSFPYFYRNYFNMRYSLLVLFLLSIGWSFGQNQGYESGELLVQLKRKTNPITFIKKFETDQNMGVLEFDLLTEIAQIYHLKFTDKSTNLDLAIKRLQSYEEVTIVQKNHFVSDREVIPSDALFDSQWHLKNTGADGGTVDADIDATDAWEITTGGLTTHNDTIVVCVIESAGVDINHEDLVDNIWKNHAEIPGDGIDNDGNGYVDDYLGWNVQTEDDAIGFGSHGTRVSGMIGAKGNNGSGISGVNWDVQMMIVKGQIASNEATVIEAYAYPLEMRKRYNESFGAEGAFVVATNASWGIDNGDPDDSPLWCAMYDSLGAYGIISVGATTNNNLNVDETGDLPTNCTSEYFIGVTMSNNEDERANSGYGTTSVDLAAPGRNVRLSVPGDLYSTTSGTSFATPCVTGAIALAYSAPCADFINLAKFDPPTAALQMRDYILDGVDEIPALVTDVATGGRLNVNNTILLMMDDCDEDACISPYNMRVGEISDTSALLVWDGFTSDYIVTITPEGGTGMDIIVSGATSLNFDTLQPCTGYTITLRADCGVEGLSEASFPIYFTTDGCCINPSLSNPDKTDESLVITWDEVLYATQYNFRYSIIDTDSWTELEDVSSPLLLEGLEGCTEYECQIYTVCDDSTRGFSESTIFRTLGCGACIELEYCSVFGANDQYEWIDSIFINGFSKGTGADNGWLVSNQIITSLTPGETYTFKIKPDFVDGSFTERYSIYIDFNQNGVFDLPEEAVVDDYSTLGTMSQDIFIPLSAPVGVTKIRIGMSALSEPITCPTDNFFGEYEDYCIYIGPQLSIPENEFNISIYPNPANDQLFIKSDAPINQVQIYSAQGKLVHSENESIGANGIDISELTSGMYIIQVETEQGISTKKFVKQ